MTNSEGLVSLVGAGPGDPELLTVKALRRLREADVVVYDRLVSDAVMELVPHGVTRIYVGKARGHHHLPQDEINRLLLNMGRGGYRVVRLKGGDPFIFGRGSEEAAVLAHHGMAFEVVPGITAATACSAYAGIPLTHRGLARGVSFVTGQCRAGGCGDMDWERLVHGDTTLVIYMGLQNLDDIVRHLLAAGLEPATPAALIENGTQDGQRRLVTTVAGLPGMAAQEAVRAPALAIVGRVVSLAGSLDWFRPAPAVDTNMRDRDHALQA